jgi:hypothetical protein
VTVFVAREFPAWQHTILKYLASVFDNTTKKLPEAKVIAATLKVRRIRILPTHVPLFNLMELLPITGDASAQASVCQGHAVCGVFEARSRRKGHSCAQHHRAI